MKKIVAISFLMASLSNPVLAQTSVTATTDLNVRAGPGPQYPVTGVIGTGQAAQLNGCLENSKWCQVTTAAGNGWAYSDYLTGDVGGSMVVLSERSPQSGVAVLPPPVDAGGSDAGAVAGGVTGAVAGAIIGGPIGAAVGGIAGAAAGGATGNLIDPPQRVQEYVTTNEVEPVYLDGEVVVGASLPDTVTLREIPDYEYRYIYVNGQPVLVDSGTRQIVYIVR